MNRRSCALLTLAICVLSSVSSPALAAPPDPAVAGEWIAFSSIQLPKGLDSKAQSGWRSVLRTLLYRPALWTLDRQAAAAVVDPAIDEAVRGQPVTLWLVPSADGAVSLVRGVETPRVTSDAPAATEWPRHRERVAGSHPGEPAAIEIAVNVNAARRAYPGQFDPSQPNAARTWNVLDALRLGNARVIGLHVLLIPPERVTTRDPSLPRLGAPPIKYVGPPLMVAAVTWSARSEPPGNIHVLPLTKEYWPQAQVGSPESLGGVAVAAARVTWRDVAEFSLDLCRATAREEDRAARDAGRDRWMREHKAEFARLTLAVDPWIAFGISDDPAGSLTFAGRLKQDGNLDLCAEAFNSVAKAIGALEGTKPAEGTWRWSSPAVGPGWMALIRGIDWIMVRQPQPETSTLRATVNLAQEDERPR